MSDVLKKLAEKITSIHPSIHPVLKKHKTVLLIALFFATGFFMRNVIAEDIENEQEIALLESIEERIETKITSMKENFKIFINPDSAPQEADVQANSTAQSDETAGAVAASSSGQ